MGEFARMGEMANNFEVKETIVQENNFKDIKSVNGMSMGEAKDFFDELFRTEASDEAKEGDNAEKGIKEIANDYIDDLRDKSEYPETISDSPFEAYELVKRSPEENAEMREEFADKKGRLKREWEKEHGMSWPKYEHDVYSANDKLIRKAGSDYDAHHIQPLGMGGKNEASNITPLNAEVHYDKQGVHAPDSLYSKLNNMIGEMER